MEVLKILLNTAIGDINLYTVIILMPNESSPCHTRHAVFNMASICSYEVNAKTISLNEQYLLSCARDIVL